MALPESQAEKAAPPEPAAGIDAPDPYRDPHCPACGYCLRGLTGERCPECGAAVVGALSDIPQIPWVHRRQIGTLRAYWQTVWRVTFRTRAFCTEISRPVSFREAQSFRWVTVAHAYLAVVLVPIIWYLEDANGLAVGVATMGSWFFVTMHFCALLWLMGISGLHTYFFHPRYLPVESQNRAVALSTYGCAPLAWLPAGVLLAYALWKLSDVVAPLDTLLELLGYLVPLFFALGWWACLAEMARRLLSSAGRVLALWLVYPLVFVALSAVVLLGLPGVLLYVVIIFGSFF